MLDLACGTGYYTRWLREAGAREVVGVDVSGAMLAVAREREERDPLGVRYVACDVAELPVLGRFDLVTAAYLFNYAAGPRVVARMCARIRGNLEVGGGLVCLVPRPGLTPRPVAETRRYGYGIEETGRSPRSTELRVTLFTDPPIVLQNRVFDAEVYREALVAAGFTRVEWVSLTVGPDGVAEFGEGFWDGFLAEPPLVVLRARL